MSYRPLAPLKHSEHHCTGTDFNQIVSIMESKPTKIALWCVPRTLSSVFCKSIAEEGNSQVFFECFVGAVHSGPEQTISHPVIGNVVSEPNFTYKYVKDEMEKELPEKELYFVKDMGYALAGRYDSLPDGYQHTFLMRHPARVFKSHALLMKKIGMPTMKSFLPKGYAFKELYDLYEYVTKELKQKSVVIDAEDLKANPKGIMSAYCHATGIPFQEDMLSWSPEVPNPKAWKAPPTCWIGNQMFGMYKEAFESTEFRSSDPKPIDMGELSGEVKECVEFCMPYYEKLREVCLKPE